ncbi:MAG: hypothetical protein CMH55_10315 [Myxococcales bacterium]|nr:hypothetical protein [Myxococcales bacterium]
MIRTDAELEGLVAAYQPERVVVDTEYASEGRYRGVLGLVQLAWADQWAIIDPLEVSLAPLSCWQSAQWVTHDGSQDWGLLLEGGMVRPAQLFDTQLAARMLGLSDLGLAKLMRSQLGEAHDKGAQRSNWLRRPLSEQQLIYAQQDVVGLQRLADHLETKLVATGRWHMTLEAGEEALDRWCYVGPRKAPAVEKFRALRRTSPAIRGRAKALLQWRESEGFKRNRPVRWLLSDEDLVAMALGRTEPKEPSHAEVLTASQPLPKDDQRRMDGEQRAALKVLKRQRASLAERVQMDPSLLAPPALLHDLVLGRVELHDQGWRTAWLEQMLNEPTDPDPAPPEEPVGSGGASAAEVPSSSA